MGSPAENILRLKAAREGGNTSVGSPRTRAARAARALVAVQVAFPERGLTPEASEELSAQADLHAHADASVEAALSNISPAYMNPIVRNAAREAVEFALGLKELPQGEQ